MKYLAELLLILIGMLTSTIEAAMLAQTETEPEPEETIIETTIAETEAPKPVETRPVTVPKQEDKGFVYYKVAGVDINKDYESYLYNQLCNRGIGWYYPYAVAQIFQESRWNPASENPNGLDKGICQFRKPYFAGRAAAAGKPNADIMNAYDSLYVYAWYMAQILATSGNNVERALSIYILGYDGYADFYVNAVMNWYRQLS